MNKKELIDAIAEKANISKKEAGEVLDATLDVIKEAVARTTRFQLIGFRYLRGSQARGKRAKPRTGEKIKIAAAKGSRLQGRCRFQRRCQQIILRQDTEGRALRFSLCFFVAI